MKASLIASRLGRVQAVRAARRLTATRGAASQATAIKPGSPLKPKDEFLHRHLGPRDGDIAAMLKEIDGGKYGSLDALVDATVPKHIRLPKDLDLPDPLTEIEALAHLKAVAGKNKVLKSFIGMGYYDCVTPGVIQRNILENPGWYTSYTPYQAEISQGRLESLLNFQTLVCDMTGLFMSNASLLDEATAAAEAMNLAHGQHGGKRTKFFVASDVHPQNIECVRTRASGMGIEVVVGDPLAVDFAATSEYSGVLLQYPSTYGGVDTEAVSKIVTAAHANKTLVIAATDLLALTMIKSPGELNMDIAVGSAQRFGVPMGFGGPHAGFLATKAGYERRLPGRIIGVSKDAQGNRALRMAMQTREQHIRRDKATSNICTAQALLANMAAMYAVYHGPEGLKDIAKRTHTLAAATAALLTKGGLTVHGGKKGSAVFFDTFTVEVPSADATAAAAEKAGLNLRKVSPTSVGVSFDEKTSADHVLSLLAAFGCKTTLKQLEAAAGAVPALPASAARGTPFLTHPVFNTHHSETQLLRYIHKLEMKDLSLNFSMISLGSCTMKLNATSEMAPVTWPEFTDMHPFTPTAQTAGYQELMAGLNDALIKITGFAAASLQPNSGAAGEYAGLMAIRSHLQATGQGHRDVCLIPVSAHGTNPASAVMAGMKVVVVASDERGNVDLADLKAKAEQHKDKLAALMITYPSTYGVFEEGVKEFCDLVHGYGGQVYMDGANMNAQVALTSPGTIGADVCHLNLHKTFCIPHGGGGPGVGAICVAKHLAPHLPGHPVIPTGGFGPNVVPKTSLSMASAPYGSALILPISWMYIRMLGMAGLKKSTAVAILNANYLAAKLAPHYPIVYTGTKGTVAHEFIIDLRGFKAKTHSAIGEEDVAKRLMDYGFHSPTMSWPVGGTLMIEPTESEDRAELDRFADALIAIRGEIEDVLTGKVEAKDSPLKFAPHTAAVISSDKWERKYSRETGAFPAPWVKESKFWPTVGRVDNVYGDRNLVCTCPPLSDYQ